MRHYVSLCVLMCPYWFLSVFIGLYKFLTVPMGPIGSL